METLCETPSTAAAQSDTVNVSSRGCEGAGGCVRFDDGVRCGRVTGPDSNPRPSDSQNGRPVLYSFGHPDWSDLNRPLMGPTLNCPFREVVCLVSWNGIVWNPK